MTKQEYRRYLHSPFWVARRAAIIKYRGEQCEECGCTKRLQLHHKNYQRVGRERPEDVELLCRWCHQRRHGFTYDHDVLERMPASEQRRVLELKGPK